MKILDTDLLDLDLISPEGSQETFRIKLQSRIIQLYSPQGYAWEVLFVFIPSIEENMVVRSGMATSLGEAKSRSLIAAEEFKQKFKVWWAGYKKTMP